MIEKAIRKVCKTYGYNPNVFNTLKYSDGGVTRHELVQMYLENEKDEFEKEKRQMEFDAQIHGAKLKKTKGPKSADSTGKTSSAKNVDEDSTNVYEYGDTSKHDHMTEEEKEAYSNLQVQQLMGVGF